MVQSQVCEAKLICQDNDGRRMLEKACRDQECWVRGSRIYKKYPAKLLTKYQKEVAIGRDGLSISSDNKFDITPFFPLLAYPQRESQAWKNFEQEVLKAETCDAQDFEQLDAGDHHSELEKAML